MSIEQCSANLKITMQFQHRHTGFFKPLDESLEVTDFCLKRKNKSLKWILLCLLQAFETMNSFVNVSFVEKSLSYTSV